MLYSTMIGGGVTKTYTTRWGGNCSNTAPYTYSVTTPGGSQRDYQPNIITMAEAQPKDRESFKKVRLSGRIKMTEATRESSVISNYLGTVPRYAALVSGPHCNDWGWWERVELVQPYFEQGDISYWSERAVYDTGMGNARDSVVTSDTNAAIASLQSSVVADNVNTYDLLTELAEGKETLAMLLSAVKAVRRPLQSFQAARNAIMRNGKLSPKQVKQQLESKWMEYRYAIMPCIYSVRDIVELLEKQGDVYKTSRAKKTLTYEHKCNWDRNLNGKPIWLYRETTGTVTVRAVGKCWYDLEALKLRLFDQVGINPFVTAWELIPFSFVVDWFANIGDWVLAQTSQVVDCSTQRVFCYSVKQDFVVETYLTYDMLSFAEKYYAPPGPGKLRWEKRDTGTHLLQRNVVKTYHRKLFSPSDVSINFEPFLNWKRSVDAWVLLQRPLINALRRLK